MTSSSNVKILKYAQPERAVRAWSATSEPVANLILLHGVVSHSEWLAPIAELIAEQGITVFCPDRRGTGLNEDSPGDAESINQLIDDVLSVADQFCDDRLPLHLGGFCWGATYAIQCASRLTERFTSLMMIAPSVFPSNLITSKELVTGDSANATERPLVPIDAFTNGPSFRNYIVPDPLKTTLVSPRFNRIMSEMNATAAMKWVKLSIPTLLAIATDDQLSDTKKHLRAFESLKTEGSRKVLVTGQHGLQFDAPHDTAQAVIDWILHQTKIQRSGNTD